MMVDYVGIWPVNESGVVVVFVGFVVWQCI